MRRLLRLVRQIDDLPIQTLQLVKQRLFHVVALVDLILTALTHGSWSAPGNAKDHLGFNLIPADPEQRVPGTVSLVLHPYLSIVSPRDRSPTYTPGPAAREILQTQPQL